MNTQEGIAADGSCANEFGLVEQLGRELADGAVQLPSLPGVVVKIRQLLEEESADFAEVSNAIRVDAALVSRIFVFANSAYHNHTGEKIENLEAAIAMLGLDLVKSTAVALVVKQLVRAEAQAGSRELMSATWSRSMKLSALSFALAQNHSGLNPETAFICGLFREIGILYVLGKAAQSPGMFSDDESMAHILDDWNSPIGKSIIESWGFAQEIVESVDPDEHLDAYVGRAPRMVDVVYVAGRLLDAADGDHSELLEHPSMAKLGVNPESLAGLLDAYKEKLASVHRTLA